MPNSEHQLRNCHYPRAILQKIVPSRSPKGSRGWFDSTLVIAINYSGCNPLGDEGLMVLATSRKNITSLNLRKCGAGPRGLLAVLKVSSKFTDLDIGINSIDVAENRMDTEVTRRIATTKQLKSLSVSTKLTELR